ncbi:MAG: hypothetical protein DMH00_01705, partial [Acidobacteria bacterium]
MGALEPAPQEETIPGKLRAGLSRICLVDLFVLKAAENSLRTSMTRSPARHHLVVRSFFSRARHLPWLVPLFLLSLASMLLLLPALSAEESGAGEGRLLRFPALSKDSIAFVYG